MTRPFLFNTIEKNMDLDRCETMNIEFETPYRYNNYSVPRVTSVLSDMLHEEYLLKWANNMGRFKHVSHEVFRDKATAVGSAVHNAIEDYIQKGLSPNFSELDDSLKTEAHNAFMGFLNWWNIISMHKTKVLMEEVPLITPYCGGTLDLLLEIDNKIYLVDFKTSTHVGFKYYIQLSAYRRMIYELYGITIDGMIILQMSKSKCGLFTEYIVDLSNYDHLNFINYCDELFGAILHGYYTRNFVENNPLMDEFKI